VRLPGWHRMHFAALLLAWILSQGACDRGDPGNDLPPLLIAILENDRGRVASLVAQGADANAVIDVASEALIARGIDVETGRRVVLTPLLVAAHVGDPDVVRLLLAHHADPSFANPDGVTPLMAAVDADHEGVVDLLLAAGGDAAVTGEHASIAMYAALRRGNAEHMAVLQRHGVPLDSRDPILAGATIDTGGVDPEVPSGRPEARRQPMGIAVDADAAKVYWTEYGTGRIRRIATDGGAVETVVENAGDGPIGIALAADGAAIYWTGDAAYPRYVRGADPAGGPARSIAIGPVVNRPRGIAVLDDTLFWTEAINGRLRRAEVSRKGIRDLFTDGISSRGDRPDYAPFFSLGLTVARSTGQLFWSDFYGRVIETARPDGAERRRLYDADSGVDFPVGVAVDPADDILFWADVAREAILQAPVSGGLPKVIVDVEDGLIEPRAVAIDPLRKQIYWTDPTRDAIGRARYDGSAVEWLPLDAGDEVAFAPPSPPQDCGEAARLAAKMFVRHAHKRVAVCLEKVDAVKSVKRRHDDARHVVGSCIGQLASLADSAGKSFEASLAELQEGICRDQANLAGHVIDECPSSAADCRTVACSIAACRKHAWASVAGRFPRAAEWLEEVRPFVAVLADSAGEASPDVARTLAVIDEIHPRIVRHRTDATPGGSLPTTGMKTSYRAVIAQSPAWQRVPDDAALRVGAPMRFIDNRDGTVTDSNTGLMWEKKCDGCGGLHDWDGTFSWRRDGSPVNIWAWTEQVNQEDGKGFAGYRDWRIPDVKELQGIVDYERFNPSVGPVFDGDRCGQGCDDLTDPACSCTALGNYWTSTTLVDDPERAFLVNLNLGLVGDSGKQSGAAVRAVRTVGRASK
jgi:hypothetical protein